MGWELKSAVTFTILWNPCYLEFSYSHEAEKRFPHAYFTTALSLLHGFALFLTNKKLFGLKVASV